MQKEATGAEKSVRYMDSPIGKIGIADDGSGISDLFFCVRDKRPDAIERSTALLKKAAAQMDEYFAGKRRTFDLPLSLSGTAFQLAVWNALLTIPYGETRSYKDIAERIGNPKAVRAVGMANNRNPVSIIVPCHRVIGSDGSLVGYGGGVQMKDFLLRLERRYTLYKEMHIVDEDPNDIEGVEDVDKEIW